MSLKADSPFIAILTDISMKLVRITSECVCKEGFSRGNVDLGDPVALEK